MPVRSLTTIAVTGLLLALAACSAPPAVDVTISPSEVSLVRGESHGFTATVTGTADTTVTWTATGGTVSGSGTTITYTAPTTPGDYTLTATSSADPTKHAAATIDVLVHPAQLWALQLGTTGSDFATAVAVDGNDHVLVAGYTGGSMFGPNQGGLDAFVAKYTADGELIWARQLGSHVDDYLFALAIDGDDHVLLVGATSGDLFGTNQGDADAFVTKLTPDGTAVWAHQLGSSQADIARAVAVDGNDNVLIAGTTRGDLYGPPQGEDDVFVAKIAPDGTVLWAHQHGTSEFDFASAVAVDGSDHVIVVGHTGANLFGPHHGGDDLFVIRLDPAGALVGALQHGTSGWDTATAVAVDGTDHAIIAGHTSGSLLGPNRGNDDVFVAKLSPTGTTVWAHQHGSSEDDFATAVAVDRSDHVLLAGLTSGDLAGPNQGASDVFITKLAPDGTTTWAYQLGTDEADAAVAVAVDSQGNVIIAGDTSGDLAGPNRGDRDAFVIKLAP